MGGFPLSIKPICEPVLSVEVLRETALKMRDAAARVVRSASALTGPATPS
jgi:hypothetical protein